MIYSFDEIMKEMHICYDNEYEKIGKTVIERDAKGLKPNMRDIARLGAEIMRLKERIINLETQKSTKHSTK